MTPQGMSFGMFVLDFQSIRSSGTAKLKLPSFGDYFDCLLLPEFT